MGSLLSSVSSNPNFMNTFSQRVLSQSNNVSYSTRGWYRVKDTEPSRKADYWFRDFGMVMACAYMAEFGFRAVDSMFTVPMITDATQLNRLSQLKHPVTGADLYPGATNYDRLPMVYKNRVMGSLIRPSSSGAVPELMKKLELEKANDLLKADEKSGKTENEIQKKVKAVLDSPNAQEAHKLVQDELNARGLDLEDIQKIAGEENKYRRESKLNQFASGKTAEQKQKIEEAVKLERARQMRILTEHLQIKMNFGQYVEKNFLDDKNKLSGVVKDALDNIADKTSALYNANGMTAKVKDTFKEVWYLSPDKRKDVFNKKFGELEKGLFFSEGRPIATKAEREEFAKLGDKFRTLLTTEGAQKDGMNPIVEEFKTLFEKIGKLSGPTNADPIGDILIRREHMNEIYGSMGHDIRDRIFGKIEKTVKDAIGKPSATARHKELENLDKMALDDLLKPRMLKPNSLKMVRDIQKELKDLTVNEIPQTVHEKINRKLAEFKKTIAEDERFLHLDHLKPLFSKTVNDTDIKRLIAEGVSSKTALTAISKIQKSSTWPKTFATVALNLVFYGFAASLFDNKVLQPYEQKLTKERGTSQEIVSAGYMGLLPGAAVLTQMFDKTSLPLFRKMGSFTRFASVGGAALATFAGSTYLILQQMLKNPPKNPPKQAQPAEQPARPQPMANAAPSPFASMASSPFASAGMNPGGFQSNFNRFAPILPRFNGQVNAELQRQPVRQG